MREVVGFAAGVTVTAAASVLLRSEAGRRLVRDLVSEAEPELKVAAEEWRPLLREVARAVKLGAREVAGAVDVLEGHLARLADASEAPTAGVDTGLAPEPTDSSQTPDGDVLVPDPTDPTPAPTDPTASLDPAHEP